MNWIVEALILLALLQHLQIENTSATIIFAGFLVWCMLGALVKTLALAFIEKIKNEMKN